MKTTRIAGMSNFCTTAVKRVKRGYRPTGRAGPLHAANRIRNEHVVNCQITKLDRQSDNLDGSTGSQNSIELMFNVVMFGNASTQTGPMPVQHKNYKRSIKGCPHRRRIDQTNCQMN